MRQQINNDTSACAGALKPLGPTYPWCFLRPYCQYYNGPSLFILVSIWVSIAQSVECQYYRVIPSPISANGV